MHWPRRVRRIWVRLVIAALVICALFLVIEPSHAQVIGGPPHVHAPKGTVDRTVFFSL